MEDTIDKETEWVVFPCPSCGKKIKLPAEKASNSKFKCPSCSQVVNLKVTEVDADEDGEVSDLIGQANPTVAVEEQDEMAAKANFLVNLKSTEEGLHVEDLEVTSEVVEKDGEAVVKRRRRVTKRKKANANFEWEEGEKKELEEEEQDEWSYAVDAEVAEDGSVVEHRRRIKKRKNTTLYEKFAGKMSTLFWVFTVVVGVALGGVAIYIGFKGSTEKPPDIAGGGKAFDTGEIDSQIRQEALDAIERYLVCESWSERVALVRTPNKVRPKMEAFYQEHGYQKIEGSRILEVGGQKLAKRNQIYRPEFEDQVDIVTILIEFPETANEPQWFALERRDVPGSPNEHEYLVDWEISEGYETVPYDVFRDSGQPGDTATFRVQLKGRVSYPIEPFQDTQTWLAFELTNPARPDFKLIGYVDKTSPVYKELTDLFIFGQHPIPIVEVRHPEIRFDRSAVEIIRMVHPTWYENE